MQEELPSYSTATETPPTFAADAGQHGPTPRYVSNRPSFTVGKQSVQALITAQDIRAHLTLLRAFQDLHSRVLDQKHIPHQDIPSDLLSPSSVWGWFLAKAAWRFELWLKFVIQSHQEAPQDDGRWRPEEIPPLDVLLVWHAFLLYPRTFYEDCLRMHPGLLGRGSFPLSTVAFMVEQADELYPGSLCPSQVLSWEAKTGQPWVAPTSPTDDPCLTIELTCPQCDSPLSAPWINGSMTGWCQKSFAVDCSRCNLTVTKEVLCVFKFSKDLKRVVNDIKRCTLATMCLDVLTGKQATAHHALFHQNLIRDLKKAAFYPSPASFSSKELHWRMSEVEHRCRIGFRNLVTVQDLEKDGVQDITIRGMPELLSAYTIPGPYSINITQAVDSQLSFVDDVQGLGWLEGSRFANEGDEAFLTLKRVVAQYHAFLDLMYYNVHEYLVPTLAIDMAWHTHMLLCNSYRESTLSLLSVIPEHDNTVEQETLAAGFEATAALWMKRFGVPYCICGCPVGGKLPASGKLASGFSKLFNRKGKSKAKDSESGLINPRPDILSPRDPAETHPSEHPAIVLLNYASAADMRAAREKMSAKRLNDDRDALSSGSASGWQELVAQIRSTQADTPHKAAYGARRTIDATSIAHNQCVSGFGKCVAGNEKPKEDPIREFGGKGSISNAFI